MRWPSPKSSWIPVRSEAGCDKRPIGAGTVGEIDSGFERRVIEAETKKQHTLAVRRSPGDALDTTRLRRKAEIDFRFAGIPGVARESVELAFRCARTVGRRNRESARAVNRSGIRAPARIGVTALFCVRRRAIWATIGHLCARRTVGADLVSPDFHAAVPVMKH